jgi:cobalt-zinc-cadmium efflux system membrane fusion protein
VHCSTAESVVQFESDEIAGLAGLRLEAVERRVLTKTVECNARLTWDTSRHARLASPVEGVVAAVHRDLGERVRRGDALVTVTSPELAAAKAAWLEAKAVADLWTSNHDRQRALQEQGLVAEREVLETSTQLAESRIARSRAEQELLRLGLLPSDLERLAADEEVTPDYVVRAPFDGVVTERAAAVGEVADSEHALYAVADASVLWAILDVYEADIPEVAAGQPVVLRIEGMTGLVAAGRITWVSHEVDPHTRTMRARAEIPNPDGGLKANLFARAEVTVRDRAPAVVVPVDAVQWEGCCNVVFVQGSASRYEPRRVALGVRTGTVYEVLNGLSGSEQVVTQGSFLLKTELMKGSIGAGCCEVQPGV